MKSPPLPENVSCESAVAYCSHDRSALHGDLYLPKGQGPFPILVGAPGGAWRICARASLRQWGIYLAARGFGLFAIDYRVATATRKAFPEAVHDVVAAVRFIRGSAGRLPVDPARIGLLGVSAGAHLSALAALAHDTAALSGSAPRDEHAQVSADVKALVAVYGIYDLFRHWQDDLSLNPAPEGNLARNLIGMDPYEDPQVYFDASPVRHITYSRNRIPVLVSWGTCDELVNPAQSEVFVRMLQQARFNVRTHRIVGASHFWFAQTPDDPTSDSGHFAPRLLAFLEASL